MTTFTTTTNYTPNRGQVAAMTDALDAIGKTSVILDGPIIEMFDLTGLPVVQDGVVKYLPVPHLTQAQIFIVSNFDRAPSDVQARALSMAGRPADYRDLFPNLEAVIVI